MGSAFDSSSSYWGDFRGVVLVEQEEQGNEEINGEASPEFQKALASVSEKEVEQTGQEEEQQEDDLAIGNFINFLLGLGVEASVRGKSERAKKVREQVLKHVELEAMEKRSIGVSLYPLFKKLAETFGVEIADLLGILSLFGLLGPRIIFIVEVRGDYDKKQPKEKEEAKEENDISSKAE